MACDGHDWEACFSGVSVPTEERELFLQTIFSGYGSDSLAEREGAVLNDPSLNWKLVDGNMITQRASCDGTDDGTHYDTPTIMTELREALSTF